MNRAEAYKALGNGNAITMSVFEPYEYLILDEIGVLVNQSGNLATLDSFHEDTKFKIWEQPKPKRKFYRWKWVIYNDELYIDEPYYETKERFDAENQGRELSIDWEEIEV